MPVELPPVLKKLETELKLRGFSQADLKDVSLLQSQVP